MKKGEIWIVELPSSNGYEQKGTRPAIVFAEIGQLAIVIPVTSNVQALRYPYTTEIHPSNANGLSELSIALTFHLRALDKKRLQKKIGHLEPETLDQINLFLKKLLQV